MIDDVLYFAANDGIHGRELWRSDGTPSGTYLLADFNPGPASGLEFGYGFDEEVRIAGLGTKIFVAADDGVHGRELWRVDALTGIKEMTADLIPPDSDREPATSPIVIGAFDGAMLFWTHQSENKLWTTGIQGGPTVVTEFIPAYPHGVVALTDDALYYLQAGATTNKFVRRDSLSTTKVLAEGTHIGGFTVTDQGFYFINRETEGAASRLWRSDGTPAGAVPITDELYGAPEGTYSRDSMTVGDSLFLRSSGDRLWMVRPEFDGFQAVPLVTTDGCPEGCDVQVTALVAADDQQGLYFLGIAKPAGRPGLWRVNELGTKIEFVTSEFSAWRVGPPVVGWRDGALLFTHHDANRRVNRLLKTDENGLGEILIKEFPNFSGLQFGGSIVFNDLQYFILGRQLWRTDGTTDGTILVRELPERTGFRALAVSSDKLYVAVYTGDQVHSDGGLWVGDGTRESSVRVTDYVYWQSVTPAHGGVYFGLSDAEHGSELWFSDGESTRLVRDIRPGPTSGLRYGADGIAIGDWFYFIYETTPGEIDLWRTDGSEAGTTKVLSRTSTLPFEFAGNLLLQRDTPEYGYELWRIDGSPEGAQLIADVNPGPSHGFGGVVRIVDANACVLLNSLEYGYEPWRLTLDPGDTNFDGVVDTVDLNNVRNNFGGSGLGDTNGDGVVNIADLNAVRNHYGDGVPQPLAATARRVTFDTQAAARDAVFALAAGEGSSAWKRTAKRAR